MGVVDSYTAAIKREIMYMYEAYMHHFASGTLLQRLEAEKLLLTSCLYIADLMTFVTMETCSPQV